MLRRLYKATSMVQSDIVAAHFGRISSTCCLQRDQSTVVRCNTVKAKQRQELLLQKPINKRYASNSSNAPYPGIAETNENIASEQQGSSKYISNNEDKYHPNQRTINPKEESNLEQRTRELVNSKTGSWTQKEVSLVRSVLEQQLELARPHKNQTRILQRQTSAADSATALFLRWMMEYLSGTSDIIFETDKQHQELINYLVRILYRRKRHLEQSADKIYISYNNYKNSSDLNTRNLTQQFTEPTSKALELVDVFLEYYNQLVNNTDNSGNKINEEIRVGYKVYSIIFEILTLEITNNAHSTQKCLDKAEIFLQELLVNREVSSSSSSQTVAWNSYLNLLAMSSPHIYDSPEKAERILLQSTQPSPSSFNDEESVVQPQRFVFHKDSKSLANVLNSWAISRRSDAPDRALQLFNSINSSNPAMLDTACYNICIRALAEAGRGQEAEELLWKMHQQFMDDNNFIARPDQYSFLAAIQAWSKSKQPERAKAILGQMISMQENNPVYAKYNLWPTTEMFTTVMDAYAKQRRNSGPQVEALLRQMEKLSDWTEWINSKVSGFRSSDNKNQHTSWKPSIVTYNTVLHAWARTNQPDAPERAWAIVEQMELYAKDDPALTPNTASYNALILTLTHSQREDRLDQALSMFHHMTTTTNRNAAANTITYNTIMDAFSKRGMPDKVLDLYNEMISRSSSSCRPSLQTYTHVIHALGKMKFEDAPERAEAIVHEMENQSEQDPLLAPNTITYNSLIQVWSNSQRNEGAQRALSILNHMKVSKNRNIVPSTITYNCVMGAFAKRSIAKEAQDLLDEMIEQSNKKINKSEVRNVIPQPDVGSWATVIFAYSRSDFADASIRARDLLHDMENWLDNNQPGVEEQSNYHNKYRRGSSPTSNAYVATIHALARCGKYEEAQDILWHMSRRYEELGGNDLVAVQPDKLVCNAILKMWSHNINDPVAPDRAEKIWRFMVDQDEVGHYNSNIKPNIATLEHMICIWEQSQRYSTKTDRIMKLIEEVKSKYPQLALSKSPWLQRYLTNTEESKEL